MKTARGVEGEFVKKSLYEFVKVQQDPAPPLPSLQTCPTSSYLYAGSSSCSRHRELDLIEGVCDALSIPCPRANVLIVVPR